MDPRAESEHAEDEKQESTTSSGVSGDPIESSPNDLVSGPHLPNTATNYASEDIHRPRWTPTADLGEESLQEEARPAGSFSQGKLTLQTLPDPVPVRDESLEMLVKHRRFLAELGERWFTVEPMIIFFNLMTCALWPALQQYIHKRLEVDYNISSTNTANLTDYEQCMLRGHEEANHTSLQEKKFQEDQSLWNTILVVSGQLPIVLVVFFLGAVSDTHGRRLTMLPQLLSQTITCAVITVVIALELPLWILALSSAINGLTGSYIVVFMSAYAYIADINPPEKRLVRLIVVEVGMGLGALLSGIAIGWIIDHWGFVVPNVILTGTMALVFAYALFFVPETILKDEDAPLVSCSYLKDLPELWVKGGGVRGTLPIIWLCLFIMFFNSMVNDGGFMIVTLYIIDPPLCWDAFMVGLYNGVTFALKALGCVVYMKVLQMFLRLPYLQLFGTVSSSLGNICLGFATHPALPFVGGALGSAAMLVSPVSRSVASAVVSETQQGALFAGLGCAQMMSTLVGSPVINTIFGLVPVLKHRYLFLGMAALCFIPFTLIIILLVISRSSSKLEAANFRSDSMTDTEELVYD